jgi:ElaB/YqjD/DUF883 family membrane-anchored ribosome-binding protein
MAQQTHKSSTQNKDKDGNGNKSAYEIESEIHETRGAITSDIRELSDRLSPAHLKEEAKSAAKDAVTDIKNAAMDKAGDIKDAVVDKTIEVKDAVAEKAIVVKDKAVEVKDVIAEKAVELRDEASEKLVEATDAVVETLDEVGEQAKRIGSEAWRFTSANAVPLALIGIGAGWLFANSKRSKSEPAYRRSLASRTEDYDLEEELDYDAVVPDSSRARPRGRRIVAGRVPMRATARARPTQVRERSETQLRDQATGLASQAGDAARTAQHKIEDGAAQSAEYLRRGAAQTSEFVRKNAARARDATLTFADENPLALAMATLVAGVGVGLLLPSTDRETKLLKPAREKFDRFIGDAREAATDVAQVARETANDSLQALT